MTKHLVIQVQNKR